MSEQQKFNAFVNQQTDPYHRDFNRVTVSRLEPLDPAKQMGPIIVTGAQRAANVLSGQEQQPVDAHPITPEQSPEQLGHIQQ